MSEPNEVYIAVGRRKTASARVRLIPGTGKVTVNKRAFEDYFPTEAMRGFAVQPLVITGKQADFDVIANITGLFVTASPAPSCSSMQNFAPPSRPPAW